MPAILRLTDGPDRLATENIIGNPSFEVATTGYTPQGTNSIERSTDLSLFGLASGRATYQDNTTFVRYTAVTLTAAQYVVSAWVFIPSDWDGGNIQIQQVFFAGATEDSTTIIPSSTTGVWVRADRFFTPVAGDLTGQIQVITTAAPTAGRFIHIDGVQLELAPLTTFCDGAQRFCVWAGTPHASASTRAAFTGTTIDLLSEEKANGFFLTRIRPQIAQYKDGGTYQSSPFADGRRLVDTKYENVIETFELVSRGDDQDQIAQEMQDIRRLLVKATQYWTARWQDEPVWIEAKSVNETNTRYALVVNSQIPEDDNPWGMPFLQPGCEAVMNDLTLVIEREHWLAQPPSESTPALISVVEPYTAGDIVAAPMASTDDTYIDYFLSSIHNAAASIQFGNTVNGEDWSPGIRFRDVQLEQGVSIATAVIVLTPSATSGGDCRNYTIRGEDTSSPAAWSTFIDYVTRLGNTVIPVVIWDIPAGWTINVEETSPDISGIVQAIVNRSDWAKGNDIAIFLDGTTQFDLNVKNADSFDGSPGERARLEVTLT